MNKQFLVPLSLALLTLGCAFQPFRPQPGVSLQQANKDAFLPCGSTKVNEAHLVYVGNDPTIPSVKVYKTYENMRYNKTSDGCGGFFYFMNNVLLSSDQYNSLISQQRAINSERRNRAEKAARESQIKRDQESKERNKLSNM